MHSCPNTDIDPSNPGKFQNMHHRSIYTLLQFNEQGQGKGVESFGEAR